jgi:O-methyltransferase
LALIEAADELGLLAEMARAPMTADEVAGRFGLDPAMAEKFLTVLIWNGILTRHGDLWALAEKLQAEVAGGALALARIEGWAARDHLHAEGIVTALRGHCRPPEIDDRYVGALAEAMARGARASAPHVARLPLWREREHLADLAGGSGGYAVLLSRLYPGLRVTVYDRPEMLEHARRAVTAAGVGERVRLEPWDLRADPVPDGHDCVLLSHVLHLLDTPGRAGLLGRVREALAEGDPVVVHDFVPGAAPGALSTQEATAAIDWLANGSGFLLGPEEISAELAACGLSVRHITPVATTGAALVVAGCAPDRRGTGRRPDARVERTVRS